MSDDDDSRRLYQEAYEDGCRRNDADLQQFVTPLEAWMDELLAQPLAPNWRDQLNEYLAEQEPKGYRIEPGHRWVLEEEILFQDRDRRILAESNTGDTAPSRVSLLAQRATPAPQEKTEKKLSKEEQQEREFRWFAREASKYEQGRLGLTDAERAEYERYLVEAQRRLAKGEPPIPEPDFYREKYLRAEEEQAEADLRTPSIKASELSDLEWEIQHIIGKLSQRNRLTEAEFQELLTRLRILQRQLYHGTGDWNFVTRTMDSLLNPAWDGIGTLNDIALMLMPFGGASPIELPGSSEANRASASLADRRRNGPLQSRRGSLFDHKLSSNQTAEKGTSGAKPEMHPEPMPGVAAKVADLARVMPEKSRGWITWSVAIVEDANGNRFTLIGTSEVGGYLRGIKPLADEIVVSGNGHAERDVIDYAIANGLRVIEIGATRPICRDCANAIAPTGAAIVTPLRKSSGKPRRTVDEDTQ